MATVIINGDAVDAGQDDNLLELARSKGAHIGFVCDGRGLCATCECTVVKGANQLSEPNEVEKHWLNEEELADGQRLACQAKVTGNGQVEIVTRAEDARRRVMALLQGDLKTARIDELLAGASVEVVNFPFKAVSQVPRIFQMLPNIPGIVNYANDFGRTFARQAFGVMPKKAESATQTIEIES
jgi:ferredoxin